MRLFPAALLLLQLLVYPAGAVLTMPVSDRVRSLPGFGVPPTPHYSGYLDATGGCDQDNNGDYCKLHYWFAMAEGSSPETKPVVLWLNGGPGSSSILGMLQENGPLLMNATGGLMKNPWSWTRLANLLILESPIGVGYSYCAAQAAGRVCKNTDKFTASAARAALTDFFTTKFPVLRNNDFFITGESYAGVYIPTIAKEILDHAKKWVNLVGLAVGDPCTDTVAQRDSMDSLWYGHKYGLVQDQEFDLLWNKCNVRQPNLMMKGGPRLAIEEVKRVVGKRIGSSFSELDPGKEEVKEVIREVIHELFQHPGPDFVDSPECKLAYRKFLMSTSKGLSQSWSNLYINDYSLFSPGGLRAEDDDMAKYMMREDVREALHVADCPTTTWPQPPQGFDYTSEYAACNDNYDPGTPSMIDIYREIAPKLDVVVVYNGDTDPCVSYEGTRTAIERVGFQEIDGGAYRPWFYNHTAADVDVLVEKAPMFGPDLLVVPTGAQFGGEVVNYEHNLSFITVHGSGHMVPQFRPQAALHMLEKVLTKEPFSPLMPKNATLARMNEKEFGKVMNKWTERAQSPPYVGREGNWNVPSLRKTSPEALE